MDYTTAAGAPSDSGHTFSQSSASPAGLLQRSSASPPPPKRRRVRAEGPNGNGCLHCRARKVKCPGKPETGGACIACVKFSFDCNFAKDDEGPAKVVRVLPSIHRTEAGTPRARAPRACNSCHAHKTRCTSEHPQCRRCKSMNIECVYEKSKRKSASAASTPRSAGPSRSSLAAPAEALDVQQSIKPNQAASPSMSETSLAEPSRRMSSGHKLHIEDILARKDVVTKAFQTWFKLLHPFPLMDFLHAESTYLEIEENRLNQNLGKIVCAFTARYQNPGSRQLPAHAEMCAKDVEMYISQHMGSFLQEKCRENLIILVITICHFWLELEMGKVWMLMGLAGRMVTALQLNWDGAGETPLEQESIRRAVWSVWKLDRRIACGFEEHLVLRDEVMHLSRPVRDEHIPTHGSPPKPPVKPPICSHHIDLHRMKHHILYVTKNLAISPTGHPRPRAELSQVLDAITQLQIRLFSFYQSLPECLKVSETSNFEQWVSSSECGSFVMMYTMFCELHIDLYRFSIPGLREEVDPEIARQLPSDWVEKSRRQAVGYAVSLSRFWKFMQEQGHKRTADDGTEKLISHDPTLIISLIQCTKVLLAARKHRLFTHLEEGSSAPLVRLETDESLAELIQSNMGHLDAFSYFFPRLIEVYTQDLRAAVQDLDGGIPYDNPRQTIGMPARKPPQNARLPGPHYMLEEAIAPPEEDTKSWQHNKSGVDVLGQLNQQGLIDDVVTAPAGDLSQPPKVTITKKPNIPVWLATARAREAPATLPSEPAIPQQTPPVPFSPFEHSPATPIIPGHSATWPTYPPHHQYQGQYAIPVIPEQSPRTPSSPYLQQQTGQQQHSTSVSTRQQLFTNPTRSAWGPEGRSPSIQSTPNTPANFSQPPLAVPSFHYTHQHSMQSLQGQQTPSMPTYYQENSPLGPSSAYVDPSPVRSALEQRLPPDAGDTTGSSHLPQTYWPSQQPPTSYGMPDNTRSPTMTPVYDRAHGAALPDPRTLASQLNSGYYVRAAGTLQRAP